MNRLVFGCGFLGSRVARRCLCGGDTVHVVTRSDDRAGEFREAGYQPIVADVTVPASLTSLPQVDTVLFAVGHDRTTGQSIEQVYIDGLRNVLAALSDSSADSSLGLDSRSLLAPGGQFIYASSTGVYGQTDGSWVDEDSSCLPTRPGGRACLAAEKLLSAHPLGQRSIVLRFAGLYGPGRASFAEQVRTGQPLPVRPEALLNLIHIDDAAAVVLAAAQQAAPPVTYCVSDGHPIARADYYREIARRIGAPEPRFAPSPAESPERSRLSADKKVRNTKLLAELEIALEYPTYYEGLVTAFPIPD